MTEPDASPALRAPDGTSTSTGQIWLIVGVFALQCAVSLVYLASFDIGLFARFEFEPSTPLSMYGLVFTREFFAMVIVTLLGYVATVVFAYVDYSELESRGVPAPFHWLLSLIPSHGSMIYVIGRSVIVYRRTRGGLAPLWAYVGANLLALIAGFVVAIFVLTSTMTQISTY